MKNIFKFLSPGKLIDNELELILVKKIPANEEKKYVPAYNFEMKNSSTSECMGLIHLRIGNNENIFYGGHIGYGVKEKFRGHHYAARSIKLLLPFAKKHNLNEIYITCDTNNLASRKTCELAGGKLIEIVDLPKHNDQYLNGDRKKCRYRFII
ncbi:MAG: Tagatose 1,6-diphosphate aldolase [Candidatus Magasanikbacteria bacterium GW2011_GWC2_37_14]|uniref:Tagatose 1,6-diphosphate aldolase n=1 Tax=Candidatus Magasanikbacteria bacterium GW2011_GWC2_37_14 TaxID=1619046 RepID=A0A0G0GNU6_9BACT|nr:MAG: Tagatose 1,6-diphosphate aldolase [Candidatus Magasanikbacteria bacterium GW2011_GWC2_37_14]